MPLNSMQGDLSAKPRVYRFPMAKSCKAQCGYCGAGGYSASQERGVSAAQSSVEKALSGPYGQILLPCNFWFHPGREAMLRELKRGGLPIVVQINIFFGRQPLLLEWIDFARAEGLKINFVFNDFWDEGVDSFIERASDLIAWFTFVVNKKVAPLEVLRHFPEDHYEKLYFQFPYNFADPKQFLSPREIHAFGKNISSAFPGLRVRPVPGMENYDPRIPEDRNLEPLIEPEIRIQRDAMRTGAEIEISIVIPSYNNWIYLENVLKHILAQDFPRERIETIVVDDGSNDKTREKVREFLRPMKGEANISYIFFPRSKPRTMGDDQFRAGVARNLGVKQARGKILLFLDSDILLPKNYAACLVEQHRRHEVVQAKRIQLNRRASTRFTRYEDVNPSRDTYLTDAGYWHEFQTKTLDWMQLDRPWRFTCTYALSVTRAAFDSIGWIRKNYIHYGYEDTELGFELYQSGARFLLSELEVYHLEHRRSRSEFFHSFRRKKLLLGKSAGTFYHNTLDPGVYQHLEWLFQPALALRLWIVDLAPGRLLHFWRRSRCAS